MGKEDCIIDSNELIVLNASKPKRKGAFEKGNKMWQSRKTKRLSVKKACEAFYEIGQDGITLIWAKAKEMALAGDTNAIKIVLDRAAPVRKGARFAFELPIMDTLEDVKDAVKTITSQLGMGVISLEEATQALIVIESNRKIIVEDDLIPRIKAMIEEHKGKNES